MKTFTIYDQPIGTSEQYARVRDNYDQMEADGLASIDGQLETYFARSAQVDNTDRVLPHLLRLLGSHLKVTIARFAKLVGWKEQRARGRFYDDDQQLEMAQSRLEAMGGDDAQLVARAICLAREDWHMRRHVYSTMAGSCGA